MIVKNLLLSTLLMTSAVPMIGLANEHKESLKQADATVAKSNRQAVLALSQLGLEKKSFNFPVFYKALDAQVAIPVGNWNVSIDQAFADENLAKQYRMLVSSRFDKLIFESGQATVITGAKTVQTPYENFTPFSFGTGSYDAYKNALLSYLNGTIAVKLQKVLADASEARYGEMSIEEAQSFITNKAKELGMPADMLETLVSSSFAFGVYLPELKGSISIAQVEKYNIMMQKYTAYETSFNAPLQTKLVIFTFDGKAFSLYKEIDSSAGGDLMGAWAKSISGSASITRPVMPRASDAPMLFREVFATSLKDSLLAISTRLKEDRKFAVSAPLDVVEGSSIEMGMGIQEDVRVDHPFRVLRIMDEKEEKVGFFKVRQPGKNCLALPAAERTASKASLIYGNAEYGDLAMEHPWTGVYADLGVAMTQGNFIYTHPTTAVETDQNGGATSMVTFGFNADLGYVLNSESMSEVWMNITLGIGTADQIDYSAESGMGAKGLIGFEKRMHMAGGLFVGLGADVAYDYTQYTSKSDTTTSLQLQTTSLLPRAKVGYMFSPNTELSVGVGYNVPLSTTAATKTGDADPVTIEGYSRAAGLDMRVAFSYHIDFAGPFAAMMRPASTVCESLKK